MSPGKRIDVETGGEEGEEASGGSLAPNPELEEALRAATEAVEGRTARAGPGEAPGEAAAAAEPAGPAAGEDSDDLALELKQTQDRLLRLQADFENFRRRALKEKTEAHQYGHQNLVKDLLSAVDNLDRAIDHASRSGGGELESLLQGVELVRRELLGALAKNGVTRIEALGQLFDPALHEAMAQAPDASVPPNTVIEELQKGYKLRDRLLRPSRVIVARAPDPEEPETGAAEGEAAAG